MLYISFLSLLVIISMSSYVHGPQGFLACELPGYTLCYFSNGFPMCFFVPRLLLYWVSSTHPSTSSGLEDRARCMAASNGPCHLVSSTSRKSEGERRVKLGQWLPQPSVVDLLLPVTTSHNRLTDSQLLSGDPVHEAFSLPGFPEVPTAPATRIPGFPSYFLWLP